MTITEDERKKLFKLIYQIEDADLLFLSARLLDHHNIFKMRKVQKKLDKLYRKRATKAWNELKVFTGLGEKDDFPV